MNTDKESTGYMTPFTEPTGYMIPEHRKTNGTKNQWSTKIVRNYCLVLCRYEQKDIQTGLSQYVWRQPVDDKDRIFALSCIEIPKTESRYVALEADISYEFTSRGINYILKGEDGAKHDMDTFKGFWSFGRTFDLGFKFSF